MHTLTRGAGANRISMLRRRLIASSRLRLRNAFTCAAAPSLRADRRMSGVMPIAIALSTPTTAMTIRSSARIAPNQIQAQQRPVPDPPNPLPANTILETMTFEGRLEYRTQLERRARHLRQYPAPASGRSGSGAVACRRSDRAHRGLSDAGWRRWGSGRLGGWLGDPGGNLASDRQPVSAGAGLQPRHPQPRSRTRVASTYTPCKSPRPFALRLARLKPPTPQKSPADRTIGSNSESGTPHARQEALPARCVRAGRRDRWVSE